MRHLANGGAWRASLVLLVVSAVGACAQLDPYPEDECGNSVVDRDLLEQCDTHVLAADQACGAPGSAGACRYVCSAVGGADADLRYACPPGFACGLDEICHRAALTFERTATDNNLALGSRLGDFDGDGALDVLTSGLSRLDASFFDADGALASRQNLGGSPRIPPDVLEIDAATADGEHYDDAVFASGGDVVVALGSDDGLTAKSYAGIRLGLEPPTFFFFVPGGLSPFIDIDLPFALVAREDGDGLRLIRVEDQTFNDAVAEWPFDEIPTSAITADFDTSSPNCDEVVFAYEDSLATFRPCTEDGSVPLEGALPDPVALKLEAIPGNPKRRLASPPALVRFGSELDGLGYELVVEVNECEEEGACDRFEEEARDCCGTYIGWSVPEVDPNPDDDEPPIFNGRFSSRPGGGGELDTLGRIGTLAQDDLALHPIAWGDFNGDHIADFVTPQAAFVGVLVPDGEDVVFSPVFASLNQGFPWSDATVADFDADGLDDVVAVPVLTPALTYLRGTEASTMTYATIQVERPYSEVRAGDLDGDGRKDIVGRTPSADGMREELGVLYFSDGGFTAPRTIGSFPIDTRGTPERGDDHSSILQLTSGKILNTFDAIDDVAAITTYPDAEAGGDRIGIALFEGRADRQLVAPITVVDRGSTQDVTSVAVGRFAGGLPTIVADAFQIDLDENLEIRGSSRPIDAIQLSTLADWFPAGVAPGVDTLYAAADFDGQDGTDELMVAVPGCRDTPCEDVDDGDQRSCCEPGSETSRVFLFERSGQDFTLSRFAGAPLELPGLSARAYSEAFGLRLGRLRPTDLDDDQASEALIMLGSRASGSLETQAYLVRVGAGGLVATQLPGEVPIAGATQAVNIFGFSVTTDGQGAPLVLLATSHGLFSTKVLATGEGPSEEIAFDAPQPVLDATGQPVAPLDVSAVEAGDLNGDGIDDLVLTRPFSTEVFLGVESFDPPEGTP